MGRLVVGLGVGVVKFSLSLSLCVCVCVCVCVCACLSVCQRLPLCLSFVLTFPYFIYRSRPNVSSTSVCLHVCLPSCLPAFMSACLHVCLMPFSGLSIERDLLLVSVMSDLAKLITLGLQSPFVAIVLVLSLSLQP